MGYENVDEALAAMPSILSSAGHVAIAAQGSGGDKTGKEELKAAAREKELDAQEAARRERQRAAKSEEQLREESMRRKARARAMWGRSGVAASGSAARVLDGIDADSENRIEDVRSEAEERAKVALATGQAQADSLRGRAGQNRRSGVDPFAVGQSILGLGRSIFDL